MSGGPCRDCAVEPGQEHLEGCDVARCLATGQQALACERVCDGCMADVHQRLGDDEDVYAEDSAMADAADACTHHDCGRDVWTGVWPGVEDARRLGLWSYWGPDFGEDGWVVCGPEHPGASPDLNRVQQMRWDPVAHRFETW